MLPLNKYSIILASLLVTYTIFLTDLAGLLSFFKKFHVRNDTTFFKGFDQLYTVEKNKSSELSKEHRTKYKLNLDVKIKQNIETKKY